MVSPTTIGRTDVTVIKISIWDKLRALETLAKHHGLVTQRVDIDVVTSAELQAGRDRVAAAAELRKASEAKLLKRNRPLMDARSWIATRSTPRWCDFGERVTAPEF